MQPLLLLPRFSSEIEHHPSAPTSSSSTSASTSPSTTTSMHPFPRRKTGLSRTATAPAMSAIRADLLHGGTGGYDPKQPRAGSSCSILKLASLILLLYLSATMLVYSICRNSYSGVKTHVAVDALYLCIVTLSTVGYGDIVPLTPATKAFACVFVLTGFAIAGVLLSRVLNHLLDLQERAIVADASGSSCIVDAKKGRVRIRTKVYLAVGVFVTFIGGGTVALHQLEELDWVDAVYLSVVSVTTVGYGDCAFKTKGGRIFSSFWLLASTLQLAQALLFLAEIRLGKRNRMVVKWIMQRDLTVEDLLAANLNRNGFLSKSEYVIYKLEQMGKIEKKDILLICDQFDELDPNNTRKITLPDLLSASR